MIKIKTAEEILFPYLLGKDDVKFKSAEKAMKEYAKQFIDLAAEKAYIGPLGVPIDSRLKVDKESILKIKQLIK